MITSLSFSEIKSFIMHQCENHFPDGKSAFEFSDSKFDSALQLALERLENCFKHINVRGYQKDGDSYFNHMHSDMYSQFLYFLSNSIWNLSANKELCDKLINLNRSLSSTWFSYKCELPNIFYLHNAVGTVIGNSNVHYSDYLVIMQNVTVNGATKTEPLKIGKGVVLAAGCKIIGGGYWGIEVLLALMCVLENLICFMML